MFTIAFISLLSAAPVQSTTITLPETVITVRSIARPAGTLVHCSAPRALENDSVQTVKVCQVTQ